MVHQWSRPACRCALLLLAHDMCSVNGASQKATHKFFSAFGWIHGEPSLSNSVSTASYTLQRNAGSTCVTRCIRMYMFCLAGRRSLVRVGHGLITVGVICDSFFFLVFVSQLHRGYGDLS